MVKYYGCIEYILFVKFLKKSTDKTITSRDKSIFLRLTEYEISSLLRGQFYAADINNDSFYFEFFFYN